MILSNLHCDIEKCFLPGFPDPNKYKMGVVKVLITKLGSISRLGMLVLESGSDTKLIGFRGCRSTTNPFL